MIIIILFHYLGCYIADNPVLCDDRLYELMTVLESLNARVSGVSTCMATQTTAPVLMRALNDIVPQDDMPVIVVAQMGSSGLHLLEGAEREPIPPSQQMGYRRVGALIGHLMPEREGGLPVLVEPPVTLPPASTNVVVKWPDERREEHAQTHPLADHLRLRDLNASPQ